MGVGRRLPAGTVLALYISHLSLDLSSIIYSIKPINQIVSFRASSRRVVELPAGPGTFGYRNFVISANYCFSFILRLILG